MRIVFAPGLFLPRFYGGVEVYTLNLCQALQELGHQVFVCCVEPVVNGSNRIDVSDETYQGIPVRRLRFDPGARPAESRWALFDPGIAGYFGSALRDWQADIVHVTHFGGLSAAIVREAHHQGIPVVYTASDFVLTCSRKGELVRFDGSICDGNETIAACWNCLRPHSLPANIVYGVIRHIPEPVLVTIARTGRWLPRRIGVLETVRLLDHRFRTLRPILREIDLIIAPSRWIGTLLIKHGADHSRIVFSEYGVASRSADSQPKTKVDHVRFGFFGRITPVKGVHHLIGAFNTLPRPHGATLTIYGAPSVFTQTYAGSIWYMASGNKQIRLAGYLDNSQVPDAMQSLDVVVVPSIWHENSPIIVLEAFACRTPVIASDVAGMSDLVKHNYNGLLVPPGNEEALSNAMQRCIDEPTLITKLVANIKPVKTILQDAQALCTHYRRLCSSAGQRYNEPEAQPSLHF